MGKNNNINDSLLALRCQEGDSEAFVRLVELWQGRLHGFVARTISHPDAAADVTQEIWEAVVRGLSSLRDTDLFASWLFGIAVNKCQDWVRRRVRRQGFMARFRRESGEDSQHLSSGDVRHDRLEQAMLSLTSEQRSLLMLHYQEGFSMEDIAYMLKIPPGTVKSRLYHARQRVRSRMEELENE